MNENLKTFLNAIAEDKEWLESHKGITDKDEAVAAALEKAAELDIPLTAADFEVPEGELSEGELAAVAGGAETHCSCALAGGGAEDYIKDDPCACVVVGCMETMICMFLGFE